MTTDGKGGAVGRKLGTCAGGVLALCVVTSSTHAELIIAPGFTYTLLNHPDGGAAPPDYGLRLDGLLTGDENDVYTFSFDPVDGADMELEFTGAGPQYTIHISGTAFGGLVESNAYTTPELVTIDFTYTIVEQVPGDDDLWVTAPNTGTGTIMIGSETINLFDRLDDGFAFRLGDEGGSGHRGFPGVSGWGWLDHTTKGVHLSASDWLFTLVPTPGTTVLIAIAMALIPARARSRYLLKKA